MSIEQTTTGALPPSAPFPVAHIEISGNTRVDSATLHALITSAEGKSLTLTELVAVAARITDYYHSHGYPLARAIIPAQTIRDGAVRIEVIEARYGKVSLDNQSRASTGLLESTLSDLRSGAVVAQAQLDRSLLLLADFPGVSVNASLKPGAAVGSSDLQVSATSLRAVTGSVMVDDAGDRYSGRERIGASVSFLEPFHHGDLLDLTALSSGSGMNYGRVSYEALLNGSGTQLGAGYSALHYSLSGRLSDLDAHGQAQDASLWTKQPLIRGRNLNLYAQIQYDHLRLNDDIDASLIETHRHLDTVTTSLSGDLRDGLLSGAVNTWAAGWTYGHVAFDNTAAQSADAVAADTQGNFSKWNLTLGRLQSLGTDDAVYLEASGQWANGNLDPSQQMIEGGPTSVRGYDVSTLAGDLGYQFSAELRHTFEGFWYGKWQAIAFADGAHLTVNKSAFAPGPNSASLGGAGVGLNWAGPDQWLAGLTIATPIGGRPELAGSEDSTRVWLQLSKAL